MAALVGILTNLRLRFGALSCVGQSSTSASVTANAPRFLFALFACKTFLKTIYDSKTLYSVHYISDISDICIHNCGFVKFKYGTAVASGVDRGDDAGRCQFYGHGRGMSRCSCQCNLAIHHLPASTLSQIDTKVAKITRRLNLQAIRERYPGY